MKFFHLPPLDPATLVGYQVDEKAKKRFESKFRLPSLVGILLLFGSPLASVFGKISTEETLSLVALGFVILFASMAWMFKSSPIGSSGRPMKKYWNSSAKRGSREAVYVCEESKTYFTRVWSRASQTGSGEGD
ncbi:MAG: hypothetical protein ACRDBP_15505 [Luteolibacter sp.]